MRRTTFSFAFLFLLILAEVIIIRNIWFGLALSQDANLSSDPHLGLGISSILLIAVGQLGLIFRSRMTLHQAALQNLKKSSLNGLLILRGRALGTGIGSMILVLLSLITGTISHSGRFPWLHGILGFGLSALLLCSLVFWGLYLKESGSLANKED